MWLLILIAIVVVVWLLAAKGRSSTEKSDPAEELIVRFEVRELKSKAKGTFIPDNDDDDFKLDAGESPPVISAHNLLLIEYRDAKNNLSRRRITVNTFSPLGDSDAYLNCWCHERKEARSFYLRRILSMTDMKTGEVVKDPLGYFADLFPKPEPDAVTSALTALESELMVLLFIARADNRMIKKERDVIVAYVITEHPALASDSERIDKLIARMHCDGRDFRTAVKALGGQNSNHRERVIAIADAVLNADGKVHADETKILEQLRQAMATQGL